MFLATLPDVITLTVSHLSFQLSVIERIISGTLFNILKIHLIMFLKAIYSQGFDPQMDSIG